MRLEGTLDAFSLPDIFQLLSYTKKTGTLHLRRGDRHGVVHLREGAVTGGRSDAGCQALGRRIVGAGLVDDDTLADAVEKVLDEPGSGLAKALADSGRVDADALGRLAAEQTTDAVFELLRWPDGEFAFVVDEANPDDLGTALAVEEVVAEGNRRLETWGRLADTVPSTSSVVTFAPCPDADVVLTRDEWALLSFVDGARTVEDLVALSGTGEFVVVSALAQLAERGLVQVGPAAQGTSALQQRQTLLAALEGRVVPQSAAPGPVPAAAPAAPVPAQAAPKQVIPERPEPFTPPRRPEHAEEPVPAFARLASSGRASAAAQAPTASVPSTPAASVGAVQGAHALAPEPVPAPSSYIDRDPSVNKSLLLRLIAGVRGL